MPTPSLGAAEFGILRCSCSSFPVVDGVPIIQRSPLGMFEHVTGEAHITASSVSEVVALLEQQRTLDALIACLLVPSLPGPAQRLPWRIKNGRVGQRVGRWLGAGRVRAMLRKRNALSVQQICGFFFRPGWPWPTDMGQYFLLRFAQPRYLAALALLSSITPDERPVLDIACGIGHFEHYFHTRTHPVDVIGTDMNFFQLWIARHWISPRGRFICANAQDGLSFADGAFSGVVCSDAYHYLGDRHNLQREIARCAPGRPVYLTRVGNRSVLPNEGKEMTYAEYLAEFGAADVRCFSEQMLLRCYLRRENPFRGDGAKSAELAESKWLSFAWNIPSSAAGTSAPDHWPHASGKIGINPIYRMVQAGNGDRRLRFEFPTPWFAYENHDMLSYHPRLATVTDAQWANRESWQTDAGVSDLVKSFVLIGLPERFDQ